jgi:putative salt-induced outer membrane protein YdiY
MKDRFLHCLGLSLLVLALLLSREAAAQIVNVQALFDDATAPLGVAGGAELSLDWRTGSTNLLVARGVLMGQWRTERHAVLGVVRGEYGFAQEQLIVSKFLEHLRYRYRFTDWLSGETFVQHELDAFRRLRLRALVGAGPRFTLWSSDSARLTVGVAGMVEHEQLRNDGEPDAGARVTEVRMSSYVLARVKVMENMSFVETLYVQPRVTRFSDLRLLNESLLLVEANKHFTFSTGLVITYDTAPPATVSRMDTQLRTALGVKF